ncbi:hypothetical protein L596_026376 [Steinernema carpocapsae]|nr:hypothetical protein L596_026376 [Steinernema carpocapsae]
MSDILRSLVRIRLCDQIQTFTDIENVLQVAKSNPKRWKQFAIVEDPIQRFAKAYTDTCFNNPKWLDLPSQEICKECGEAGSGALSVGCFLNRYNKRLRKIADGETEADYVDKRFLPQNWFCKFHSTISSYQILKVPSNQSKDYKDVSANLGNFFAANGVKKYQAEVLGDAFKGFKLGPKTKRAKEVDEFAKTILAIQENPTLKEMIMKTYYFDYFYFGYDMLNGTHKHD